MNFPLSRCIWGGATVSIAESRFLNNCFHKFGMVALLHKQNGMSTLFLCTDCIRGTNCSEETGGRYGLTICSTYYTRSISKFSILFCIDYNVFLVLFSTHTQAQRIRTTAKFEHFHLWSPDDDDGLEHARTGAHIFKQFETFANIRPLSSLVRYVKNFSRKMYCMFLTQTNTIICYLSISVFSGWVMRAVRCDVVVAFTIPMRHVHNGEFFSHGYLQLASIVLRVVCLHFHFPFKWFRLWMLWVTSSVEVDVLRVGCCKTANHRI